MNETNKLQKCFQNNNMIKNPNVLAGHEGELLRIIGQFNARIINVDNFADGDFKTFGGTKWDKEPIIVMLLECGFAGSKDFRVDYIDFLHFEQRYRVFHSHNRWMDIFIPWPRGGFIQRE